MSSGNINPEPTGYLAHQTCCSRELKFDCRRKLEENCSAAKGQSRSRLHTVFDYPLVVIETNADDDKSALNIKYSKFVLVCVFAGVLFASLHLKVKAVDSKHLESYLCITETLAHCLTW